MRRSAEGQLFINAKVFTGEREDEFASAFRINDGEFTWVGSQSDVRGETAVDLHGRTVLPGLLDVHTHPSVMATLVGAADCLPPAVSSIEQLLVRLRGHANCGKASDLWIDGHGFDDSRLAERRPPTARELDLVSSSQPVLVRRCDGHSAVCNSRALELAGITETTPDPPGGRFERDDLGRPNGILTEISAVDAVRALIPPASYSAQVADLAGLNEHFVSHGIVALCDMRATALPDPLRTFRDAESRGLRPRCTLYYSWDGLRDAPPELTDADRRGRVRVGGVKLFMDGAYSNRTAWVDEPYPGSADHGMATLPDDEAREAVAWARRNQVQVAIHAMGDRAVEHAVALFGDEEPWLAGRPSIRLEHATLMSADTIGLVNQARMSFAVVTHTIFLFAEYDSYRRNLSGAQSKVAYPIRSLYETVPVTALSSDCPATAWGDADNVFVSVQAAVRRRAYDGSDIGQDAAVSVPQALLLYTSRARKVAHVGPVGKICPAYEGSFVVLDRDIFSLPVDEIDQVQVHETWIAGDCVYQGRP